MTTRAARLLLGLALRLLVALLVLAGVVNLLVLASTTEHLVGRTGTSVCHFLLRVIKLIERDEG